MDSSWVLVKAKQAGLNPLCVHMDNGWNSELAQNNIANLVHKLDVDLYTHVIRWEEYRALMQAFFNADVVDIELLYDNAMLAVNYEQAKKFSVKYILSGSNKATEGMTMPRAWHAFKFDKRNIKNLAGKLDFNTFPSIGTFTRIYHQVVHGTEWLSLLDELDFNKFEAMEELTENFGYKKYPYKHYESIFTRFYQGYILPTKFGIDKRKVHFSSLIISGQMSRDDALKDLQKNPYSEQKDLESDLNYFLKKMDWDQNDLAEYIQRPRKEHEEYGSGEKFFYFMKNAYSFLKKASGNEK